MQEGHFYHIYNKGINDTKLFYEKRNYYYFLKQYKKYLSVFLYTYSYCLMPNHFHFLVKIKILENNKLENVAPDKLGYNKLTPIEKGFRNFFMSYTKAINKAYNRTGDLFQSKFKRKKIENGSYLTKIVPYIHLNPLRAKLCKNPEDWEFSSYKDILINNSSIINVNEVMEWFEDMNDFVRYHKEYRDYQIVRDYILRKETSVVSNLKQS